MNDKLKLDMFNHGDQDNWRFRYKLGISPPVTVYTPTGEALRLSTKEEMVLFYEKVLNLDIRAMYKKP